MTNHINLDQDFGLGLFFDVALFRLNLTADEIVQLLMSSRVFSLLIRVVIYQNVHLDE